jgi:hypothetical protein
MSRLDGKPSRLDGKLSRLNGKPVPDPATNRKMWTW